MGEFLSSFDLNSIDWILIILSAVLIGISKTGISGAGLVAVPVLAGIFGGKSSTGIVLPMLIMADIFAVKYYNRHAQWRYILNLLPWAIVGVITGMLVGNYVNDKQFSTILSFLVMAGIGLMIYQDIKGKIQNVPDYWWFAALMGFLGGITTMIGNAAGPVMALYLLSMRLPKNIYIGTGAWFFFIINFFKVPLHVFVWGTISFRTFLFDLVLLFPIMIGVLIGIVVVKKIPEKFFRYLIIVTTVISAIVILFK